jgi:DNA-binding GntR family transcriptional regulator
MSLEDRSGRIDKERPIWQQVAGDIERDIRSGALAPGTRLPSEDDLVIMYGVARNTVRRAIEGLRERGLAETFHGRGTYVAQSIPRK